MTSCAAPGTSPHPGSSNTLIIRLLPGPKSHHGPGLGVGRVQLGRGDVPGAAHDVIRGDTVRSWSRLGGVGEGEAGGVDDSVIAHQSNRYLGRLPDPLPPAPELGDV